MSFPSIAKRGYFILSPHTNSPVMDGKSLWSTDDKKKARDKATQLARDDKEPAEYLVVATEFAVSFGSDQSCYVTGYVDKAEFDGMK